MTVTNFERKQERKKERKKERDLFAFVYNFSSFIQFSWVPHPSAQ
jgi:hypothetical protein